VKGRVEPKKAEQHVVSIPRPVGSIVSGTWRQTDRYVMRTTQFQPSKHSKDKGGQIRYANHALPTQQALEG